MYIVFYYTHCDFCPCPFSYSFHSFHGILASFNYTISLLVTLPIVSSLLVLVCVPLLPSLCSSGIVFSRTSLCRPEHTQFLLLFLNQLRAIQVWAPMAASNLRLLHTNCSSSFCCFSSCPHVINLLSRYFWLLCSFQSCLGTLSSSRCLGGQKMLLLPNQLNQKNA